MRRALSIVARLPQRPHGGRPSLRVASLAPVLSRSLASLPDSASSASSASSAASAGPAEAATAAAEAVVDTDVLATITSSAGAASGAIEGAADAVLALQDALPGLGAAGALVLSAAAVRAVSLPLLHLHQLHGARAAAAGRELAAVQQWVRRAPGTLWQKYNSFRRLRAVALRSAGTSSLAQLPWFLCVHVPLVATLSLGVRALAARRPADWADAGPPWAPDLCAADPTAALPVLTTALWLWNAGGRRAAARGRDGDRSDADNTDFPADAAADGDARARAGIARVLDARRGQWMVTALQGLALLSFPYVLEVPAGVHVLWVANGALTALQRAALRSASFRRAVGLPTAEEIDSLSGPPVLRATAEAMRSAREQLEYVQSKVLTRFPNRTVDEQLRRDVNRALERELFARRISIRLEAVVRKDGDTGRKYLAVVKQGTAK